MRPNRIDPLAEVELPPCLEQGERGIRLTGHRVGLVQILNVLEDGVRLAEIEEMFPTVPAEQLAAVVAFCERHPVEMRAYHQEQRATFDALAEGRMGNAPSLMELRRRKAERDRVGSDR